jgi:FecR protein
MLRRGNDRCAAPLVIAVGLFFGASELAWAQENIGGAKVVINNVQGDLPTGNNVPVVQGDNVFLNEAVHSGPDSKANLLLKDNSDVTIGPGSTVKLDDFVYSGPKSAGTIGLNMTKGTLRFVTGDASKRAYTIWTPTAAIGVRGTTLRIKVTDTGTTVINEEGKAIVCHRGKNEYATVEELRKRRCDKKEAANRDRRGCGCEELLVPGQQATVSPNQIAITEAPLGAISEPIIGAGIGGAGIGFASAPLIIGAGVAAAIGSAIAVSEASNAAAPATPATPVTPP